MRVSKDRLKKIEREVRRESTEHGVWMVESTEEREELQRQGKDGLFIIMPKDCATSR